jgi:hypothetical protein
VLYVYTVVGHGVAYIGRRKPSRPSHQSPDTATEHCTISVVLSDIASSSLLYRAHSILNRSSTSIAPLLISVDNNYEEGAVTSGGHYVFPTTWTSASICQSFPTEAASGVFAGCLVSAICPALTKIGSRTVGKSLRSRLLLGILTFLDERFKHAPLA